jgi:cytochrome c5
MKWTIGKGVLWFWTSAAMAAMAFAAVQEAQLPEGDGKKIIEEKCVICHDVMPITEKRASKDDWAETIQRMKLSGADLDDAQTNTLVEYLAMNLGPAGSTASAGGGLPEGAGKQIIETACTGCHGVDYVTDARYSKDQWQEVIDRMKLSGAAVGDSEVPVLLDYLTRNFGPRQ